MTAFASITDRSPSPTGSVIKSVARTTLAAILPAVVLLLVARRLAGALSEPLPIEAFALLGLIFALAAVLVRQALFKASLNLPDACIHGMGTLVAVAGALSVSLPTASAMGLLALWLPVALEEGWSWRQWFAGRPVGVPPLGGKAVGVPPEAVTTNEPKVPTLDSALSELALADTTVTQHLVRRQEPNGIETISGCLRATFLPGQRTVNVHVPFCPPLATLPPCSAETIDGPPARVKVAQVLPQGARLEVRLDTVAAERQQVGIEFSTM